MKTIISTDPRLKELYRRTSDYYKRLKDFFRVETAREPPIVMTCKEDIEVYPSMPDISAMEKRDLSLKMLASALENIRACYYRDIHSIYFNRIRMEDKSAEIHEATHSAVNVDKHLIRISPRKLKKLNGDEPHLGRLLHESLDRFSGLYDLKVSVSEFFPPIGEAYLLICPMRRFWTLGVGNAVIKSSYSADKRLALRDYVVHLPQIAGEFLVKQYRGDVRALMREHPKLPHLSGKKLWKQYCRPLLENGRLK